MQKQTAIQQWEVDIQDVQGRLANLYLWPGTLTQARLKFQIVRGDVVEHQELTPFHDITNYEVKFNYRFLVTVSSNCSHIHLIFVSGDLHPISGKPKLIARSRVSFKDVSRLLPLDKYYTLYRKDRVTQNCIAGGYIRMGFTRRHQTGCNEGYVTAGERMSMDQVSVCSSAREEPFPFTHPYQSEAEELPQRPASAVPRMLVSEDIQSMPESDDVYDTDSVFGKTERSQIDAPFQSESEAEELAHHLSRAEQSAALSNEAEGENHSSVEMSDTKPRRRRGRKSHEKGQTHAVPWVSAFFGATLGVIGTVAVIAVRYLLRRNSRRHHARKCRKADAKCCA